MEEVPGSDFAKKRAQVILRAISGDMPIEEACKELDISRSRFYELRTSVAAGVVELLEPRPAGRPPEKPEIPEEVTRLQRKNERLEEELRLTRAEAELSAFLTLSRRKKN